MNPVETELKFQVAARSRAALRRAVGKATAHTVLLRAAYFDTADRRLAAAGMALRLRQEGDDWVQTLKGRGDGVMQRLEHEVALAAADEMPALDPARHAGTPAGDALARLLADGAPLLPMFRTDIQRLQRRVRSGGATIELAFDEGRILAGERELAVCEIEFELISGPPAALLALAARWVLRHRLWLDVRSKAERGWRLALGVERVPAVKSNLPKSLPDAPSAAFAAMLQSALAQVLPNAAELADGTGSAETLHQLRVGLRRLRSALRLLAAWSGDASATLALEQRWREPFARLGAARDTDVLDAWLRPALALAGAPPLPALAPPDAESPGAVVREPAFSALVLQMLQLALSAAAAAPAPGAGAARDVLKPAWKRLLADAKAFAQAPVDEQHSTRKRLKRLRYATEFLQPMLPRKTTRRALAAMRAALDALGLYNDVLVAQSLYQPRGTDDPGTAFALGWLAAQRETTMRGAALALAQLAKTPRFWP